MVKKSFSFFKFRILLNVLSFLLVADFCIACSVYRSAGRKEFEREAPSHLVTRDISTLSEEQINHLQESLACEETQESLLPPENTSAVEDKAFYWSDHSDPLNLNQWNMIYYKKTSEKEAHTKFYCTFNSNLKTEEIRLWIQSLTGDFP
jgi:hypothetical protein